VQKWSYEVGTYVDNGGNARDAEVLFYRVAGGGHNWPGDSTSWPAWAAPVNQDFSASQGIWNFFSRHEVAAIPEPSCLLHGCTALVVVYAWRRLNKRRL
jgi:poly(3-hydroxybutyrate) depolymerase